MPILYRPPQQLIRKIVIPQKAVQSLTLPLPEPRTEPDPQPNASTVVEASTKPEPHRNDTKKLRDGFFYIYRFRSWRLSKLGCQEFLVEWVGYQNHEDFTWEPANYLRKLGFGPRMNEFKTTFNEIGALPGDIPSYPDVQARIGAAHDGDCVYHALLTAARLSNSEYFINHNLYQRFVEKRGLSSSYGLSKQLTFELLQFLNKVAKARKKPVLDFNCRRSNILQGSVKEYIDIALPEGVYVCTGMAHLGVGHMFVLQVTSNGIQWLHDSSYKRKYRLHLNQNKLQWIKHWSFMFAFTFKST
jgi:hypothetical protein